MPVDYEAFLIPNPESWEPPDGFWPADVGVSWLRQQPRPRAVVVPTLERSRELHLPNDVKVVTPRSRYARGGRQESVLVCFALDPRLIAIAEDMRPSRLCVTDYGSDAVRAWADKHNPIELVPEWWEGDLDERESFAMPPDVADEISHVIAFDGHNQFIGAGGKSNAVRALRRINDRHPGLDSAEFTAWLLTLDGVQPPGAKRLGKWFEEVQRGVNHRDHGGGPI